MNPDVVFATRGGYGSDLDPDIEAKIEQTGIPVVFINCLEPEEIPADIQKLGLLFSLVSPFIFCGNLDMVAFQKI